LKRRSDLRRAFPVTERVRGLRGSDDRWVPLGGERGGKDGWVGLVLVSWAGWLPGRGPNGLLASFFYFFPSVFFFFCSDFCFEFLKKALLF
jgi:hypothetical protein